MENITIRAITIGVGVLVAVATISAVMTYYSTAQEMVRNVGSGTDISGLYDQGIESILLKNIATGVEVKNLINYFETKKGAQIKLDGVNVFPTETEYVNNILDSEFLETIKLSLIPTAKYNINYTMYDNTLSIKVSGGT